MEDRERVSLFGLFRLKRAAAKERKKGATEKYSPSEMGQFCPFGDSMHHVWDWSNVRVSSRLYHQTIELTVH